MRVEDLGQIPLAVLQIDGDDFEGFRQSSLLFVVALQRRKRLEVHRRFQRTVSEVIVVIGTGEVGGVRPGLCGPDVHVAITSDIDVIGRPVRPDAGQFAVVMTRFEVVVAVAGEQQGAAGRVVRGAFDFIEAAAEQIIVVGVRLGDLGVHP